MCLTTQALAVFLNLIIASDITMTHDRIVVHATERDTHWVLTGGRWCTMAPQIDRIDRFAAIRPDAR